ncbi:hypothetical protein MMYC01_203400 [Madurella mycetomatis]|uniref:Uncharacterized protein n=1 Tax=Madurella mycetomatis TaxID=100816 RepID=A0A175WCI8_9PEZI|nr:hypothetical protein MMYC01_203400 [Madurella mycetomatis]
MPPKRAAGTVPSRAKKPRQNTGGETDDATAAKPVIPRSDRWAAVSGSANADADYRQSMENPVTAYSFVCLCRAPFTVGIDDDEEDEEEDEAEEGKGKGKGKREEKKPPCDGGKTCLCNKPAAEHPGHVWKLSAAGKRKFFTQRIHFELRCPDNFGMYTFNDHAGYGMLEIVQNLILDFEEAAGNHKEQWAVCEALAFLLHSDITETLTHIDDGETVETTFQLVGRMFLAILAKLERANLLGRNSEIQNLGLIMSLFMAVANDHRPYGLLEKSRKELIGPAKDKKWWQPHAFDNHILAYARKYDIDLAGRDDTERIIAEANDAVELPTVESKAGKADPFKFARELDAYKMKCGGISAFMTSRMSGRKSCHQGIGGDNLDITTWSSAARKKMAFDERDPLGKRKLMPSRRAWCCRWANTLGCGLAAG